jgi:uncharacterized phage infection (PIP) family protein YhgE
MALKDLWSKVSGWLEARKAAPEIDDQGLISRSVASTGPVAEEKPAESSPCFAPDGGATQGRQALVKAVPPMDKTQSLEKLQAGFDKLVEQLEGINNHLDRQTAHNEELMKHLEQLPKLLESFPAVVENQKKLTEQLLEQLKTTAAMEREFIGTIEKIPAETAKQTNALTDIDRQLAAAAAVDVQMTEGLNKFSEALNKLNQSTIGQTEGILQMSRTFAASDRYLKYIISSHRRSFIWLFTIAVGVCTVAILILVGIIIYLRH